MFNMLSLLVLVAPLVSGLTLQMCPNPQSGVVCNVRWTSAAGDPPTFTLQLVNEAFHDTFAISNNVMPEAGELSIQLPSLPARDGYTLQAIDISNASKVYATTASFSVGDNSASTSSIGSTTSSGLTTSSGSTVSVPATTRSTTSTSVFGTTRTNIPTSSVSNSASSTASSNSPATTSNAATSTLKISFNFGAYAAVLFSAVAGAAIVVL